MVVATPTWMERYERALTHEGDATTGVSDNVATEDPVHGFLREVLDESTKDDTAAAVVCERLSAIGHEVCRAMTDISSSTAPLARDRKLRVLQLQCIARILCCTNDKLRSNASQSTTDHEDKEIKLTQKPKKARKGKKKKMAGKRAGNEPQSMEERQGELRALLDRIALLLDATSPASIVSDGDDALPPFHEFLVEVLERQLGPWAPETFRFLRDEYELGDDEDDVPPRKALLKVLPSPVKSESSAPPTTASILSALKDERPSKKRPRVDANDISFREMALPGPLQRASAAPSRRIRSDRHRRSLPPTGMIPSTSTVAPVPQSKPASTAQRPLFPDSQSRSNRRASLPSSLSLSSSLSTTASKPGDIARINLTAAAAKRPRVSRTASMPAMPTLLRATDRARSLLLGPKGSAPAAPARSSTAPTSSATTRAAPTASASIAKASVVMRTPDRPQRGSRPRGRILIEASPPLRNPFAAARPRRPGSQLPH